MSAGSLARGNPIPRLGKALYPMVARRLRLSRFLRAGGLIRRDPRLRGRVALEGHKPRRASACQGRNNPRQVPDSSGEKSLEAAAYRLNLRRWTVRQTAWRQWPGTPGAAPLGGREALKGEIPWAFRSVIWSGGSEDRNAPRR